MVNAGDSSVRDPLEVLWAFSVSSLDDGSDDDKLVHSGGY